MRNRHRISAVIFFATFAIDLRFLPDSTSPHAFLILGGYLVASILAFWFLARATTLDSGKKWSDFARVASDFAMQWIFGSLASAAFVFYFRGAEVSSSFSFLLILLGLLFANEFDRRRIIRLEFRFAGLLLFAYAFALYVFPLIFKEVSEKSSSVAYVSVILYALILVLPLRLIARSAFEETKTALATLTIALFMVLPALVHFGVVPPLPFVLREGRVLSSIERANGSYDVKYEQPTFLRGLNIPFLYPTFHIDDDQKLVFFTAINAPAEMDAIVTHTWETKTKNGWAVTQVQKLFVHGGRKEGFRTYSIGHVSPGLYRVTATLGTGQVLGRRTFYVASGPAKLIEQQK